MAQQPKESAFFTITDQELKTGSSFRLNNALQILAHREDILENRLAALEAASAPAPLSASSPAPSIGQVLFGSRSDKANKYLPADYVGYLFIETGDGTLTYSIVYQSRYVANVATWVFLSGRVLLNQSSLAAFQAKLGTADTGLEVGILDYAHVLYWGGSSWSWYLNDDRSCRFEFWQTNPGTGWALCDGSSTTYLKSDGTTGSITLPDAVSTSGYLKSGTYVGTIVAAATPTNTAVSAGTPAGTVSQPTFSGSALATHQHELPFGYAEGPPDVLYFADASTFGTGAAITMTAKNNGTEDTSSIATYLSQAVSAGTPAGTVSQPTFSGTALGTHTHTISMSGGDPVAHLLCPLYFRR